MRDDKRFRSISKGEFGRNHLNVSMVHAGSNERIDQLEKKVEATEAKIARIEEHSAQLNSKIEVGFNEMGRGLTQLNKMINSLNFSEHFARDCNSRKRSLWWSGTITAFQ